MGHRISLPKSSKQGEFAFLLKSVKFSYKTEMTKNLFYFILFTRLFSTPSWPPRGLLQALATCPAQTGSRPRNSQSGLSNIKQPLAVVCFQLEATFDSLDPLSLFVFRTRLETVSAELKKKKKINVKLPFKSVNN